MTVIILIAFILGFAIGAAVDNSTHCNLKTDRDYWEFEAKKWAAQLAELRCQIQKEKCAKCKFGDTRQCKEC